MISSKPRLVSSEHALLLVGQDGQHLLIDRNSANALQELLWRK